MKKQSLCRLIIITIYYVSKGIFNSVEIHVVIIYFSQETYLFDNYRF